MPNDSWKGVLDATMERSGCVETYPDGINGFLVRGEEDCLYVNVYTPQVSKFRVFSSVAL